MWNDSIYYLNVKFSNLQLSKLKSGIKNSVEVILNLSSNVIDNFISDTNFPHKFLLTNTQVSRIGKTFANKPSADIKLSKTWLSVKRTIRIISRQAFNTITKN